MITFLFQEDFVPYTLGRICMNPQVTVINAGDTFNAIKAYWEHNTLCDWYGKGVQLYERGQGFIVIGEDEVLILQFSGSVNRFLVKWVSLEEVVKVSKPVIKAEFANGFYGIFHSWNGGVLAYEQAHRTKVVEWSYEVDYSALFR